ETELAAEWPLHVAAEWIGNSALVAVKHYLTVRDEDFARAAAGGAESGARAAQNQAQHTSAPGTHGATETQKAREKPGSVRVLCGVVQGKDSPHQDSNLEPRD